MTTAADIEGPKHAVPGPISTAVPATIQTGPPLIYVASVNKEFRQAEIITDLIQVEYDGAIDKVRETRRPCVIVLTQDCDLLQDFERGGVLNGLLLYEVQPYDEAKAAGPPGRDIWKRILENNDERFHFLEAVPAALDALGKGLPAQLIDFRRCFTMAGAEIARQCAESAKRRCRLETPYREHLQSRAAFYMQRVGLPAPHNTDNR